MSLLIHTVSSGNIGSVQVLLDSGFFDVQTKNLYKRTALHLAALEGHLAILRLLLQYGANVNDQDEDEMTPLHFV